MVIFLVVDPYAGSRLQQFLSVFAYGGWHILHPDHKTVGQTAYG